MKANVSIRRGPLVLCWNRIYAGLILIFIGTIASHAESFVPRSAVYTIENGDKLRLLIWQAPVAKRPTPAAVLFHGGGWRHGRAQQFRKICEILASDGVTCISVNYTLGGGDLPVEEASKAVAWVRDHAASLAINPKQIAVGGMSVGGFLAASTVVLDENGSAAPRPNAMILMSPVLDPFAPGPEISLADRIRGPLPPTRIFHGTADHLVSIKKTERFVAAARRAGSPNIELIRYPDRGHGAFRYIDGDPSKDFFSAVARIEQLFADLGWITCTKTRTPTGDDKLCHGRGD